VARAEQQRLDADAALERHARASELDLQLREQRAEAARRERQASEQERQARRVARRERRAQHRDALREAFARWSTRALFVLPICFPMAVAWVGQIRFAVTVMHWPLAGAVVFAAGFELSTAYVARLDWQSRTQGDNALLFRGATWTFAGGAAVMNYWHAAGAHLSPNGAAVSYGLMSLTGVILWELLSTYRHRAALRAEGKLPPARPRFGLARWVWFAPLTRLAWLLALRDGYRTTDDAWRAAVGTIHGYGNTRAAVRAVRAGLPAVGPDRPGRGEGDRDTDDRDDPEPGIGVAGERGNGGSESSAVGARMLVFARQRRDAGVTLTGAELDRHFGTRDYGRKILRRLAADSRT
jgi:hypothetical protein